MKWLETDAFEEAQGELQTKLEPVDSSNLAAVGYDETNKWLEIAFLDGSIYRYYRVPKDIYETLMDAPSHGTYFYWNIRENYEFDRIAG